MESHQFDALTRKFSSAQTTRRAAIGGIAAGFAAAALGRATHAQDATPIAASDHQEFLFVQIADQGTWIPSADEAGVYLLTLTGASSQTIFFSDRPQRIVGTVPTTRLFETLGFTPENAPNAAIVAYDETGERDVLVVELFDPVMEELFGDTPSTTVTYKARVLDAFAGENLDEWQTEQDDDQLDHTFSDVSLFIDDCPDLNWCNAFDRSRDSNVRSVGPLPVAPLGQCWNWDKLDCIPCTGAPRDFYHGVCNREYPECKGTCTAEYAYWP